MLLVNGHHESSCHVLQRLRTSWLSGVVLRLRGPIVQASVSSEVLQKLILVKRAFSGVFSTLDV